MKKVFTYLGLILATCLVLVACASNKPAEKKKATPTPTERAKADATVLIDDKLKQWNQADNNDVEKGKAKDLTTKFLYGENFNGDLTQFKDIDKEISYTPLTGADNLEKTFKITKDDGGNWTISVEDYKELAEALVDHDESGSRAVYAERIHKNLSDYQPEDSSDSSSKSSYKDK